MKYLVGLVFLFATICRAATGVTFEELGQALAGVFDYPADRIVGEDRTQRYNQKKNTNALGGYMYDSKDGSLARFNILVQKHGTILNDQKERDLSKMVDEGSKRDALKYFFAKLPIDDGGYLYLGAGVAGPGGSAELIYASWPNANLDIQMGLNFPRDGLQGDERTEHYRKTILTPSAERQAMIVAAFKVIQKYAKDRGWAAHAE